MCIHVANRSACPIRAMGSGSSSAASPTSTLPSSSWRRPASFIATLTRRCAILTSIPGIGTLTAVTLLANFAELGSCTRKQAAMIAGLAPIACDSGQTNGGRHIKGGRAEVRTGVYMAALSAANSNADLKRFYDRLLANGKLPKVALTAVMRKLIALANTLIREDR